MSYQIKEVIENYLKEETITRLSIEQIKTLPNIAISLSCYSEKLYERLENEFNFFEETMAIISMKDLSMIDKSHLMQKLYYDYIYEKILTEKKFKELNQYFPYKNSVVSCRIKIKNSELFCPEPDIKLSLKSYVEIDLIHLFLGNLNESYKNLLHNMDIEHNLDKIIFEVPKLYGGFIGFVGQFYLYNFEVIGCPIGKETDMFYRASSSQILGNQIFCDHFSDNQIVYSNYGSEICLANCIAHLNVRKYKCLARTHIYDVIEHLEIKNYNICTKIKNYSDSNNEDIQDLEYCNTLCRQKCNSINYDISVKSRDSFNSTKLNLIPTSSKHFRYTETFKTDINGFIYNLGGAMGLWFGISPLSIVYLISLFTKLFRKTKHLMTSFTNCFKPLIIRLVFKTKIIFTFCINRLIRCFTKMIQILFNLMNLLCIHCLHLFDD